MARRVVTLPITAVTLLEDRAQVRRCGTVKLEAASERITIERIAPVAADRTLSVTVAGNHETARVVDARIRRRMVLRVGDDEAGESDIDQLRAELDQKLEGLDASIAEHRAHLEVMKRQAAALGQAATLALTELSQDVAWGRDIGPEWAARLDDTAATERALQGELVTTERTVKRLDGDRAHLANRISALDRPDTEQRADLDIDLSGPAGESCELHIDYVVPGALWRPWHTARLDDDKAIELSTDACVWQRTGEDWHGVELSLSTRRASLGARPPRLQSDVVTAVRRAETVVVETREQAIEMAGLGGDGAVSPTLPGIDDGGEVVTLSAPSPATIPSDGRPHRVHLAAFTGDATVERVAYPEQAPAVVLKSTQQNRGSIPLLAGPVDLVRKSGFVGRTSILFVAPGERFALGWGPDADLRVSREVEVIEEKSRMLTAWTQRQTRIRVRLSNLGGARHTLTVVERIPVSEIEKVKIEVDPAGVTDRIVPDDRGFLSWTVDLAAFGHHRLEATYLLKKHDDIKGL
ncbi:MAG TPA: mucoidy inhibitor MuiA family protein [Kofleriaceae bacterium]|nr:mucoidy inhibitor MuiA family protein [Kofleriaceae bacterium]